MADTWTQKDSLQGGIRDGAVGFSIGAKGYIVAGYNSGAFTWYNDFWEWDPSTDSWTQKADFSGGTRSNAVGFSIGSKGYIGVGLNQSGPHNDFWEWDPVTNIWTQKSDFGGAARWIATGFSIGTKGYIGTGSIGVGPENSVVDFWEWDGDTASVTYDTWIQKADFPGVPRSTAVGFSIGTFGYIGLGTDAFYYYDDFWEWNQATNTWTQKADFGGTARQEAACFSIGNKGYVGTGDDGGNKRDFWEWNGDTASVTYNTWIQKTDFGGAHRRIATGFSIGNRGYIGMGFFFTVSTNDFWEYCDTCSGTGITDFNLSDFSLYPNPANQYIVVSSQVAIEEIEIFNSIGEKVHSTIVNGQSSIVNCQTLLTGIYFIKLYANKKSITQKIIITH